MVKFMQINETVAKDVMSVKKEHLDATFNAIKKRYGSVDNFLKAQMGLSADDLKTLRKKYLD